MADKSRSWGFILYPESAPDNWLEILDMTGIPIAISPCHDKDLDKEGNLLKPHYHVVVYRKGPTTFKAMARLSRSLNATRPIELWSLKGSVKYLNHSNAKNKFQYSQNDIMYLNEFPSVEQLSEETDMEILQKTRILKYIRENSICEYADLVDAYVEMGDDEALTLISTNTYFFNTYLRSSVFRSATAEQKEHFNATVDFPVPSLDVYDPDKDA